MTRATWSPAITNTATEHSHSSALSAETHTHTHTHTGVNHLPPRPKPNLCRYVFVHHKFAKKPVKRQTQMAATSGTKGRKPAGVCRVLRLIEVSRQVSWWKKVLTVWGWDGGLLSSPAGSKLRYTEHMFKGFDSFFNAAFRSYQISCLSLRRSCSFNRTGLKVRSDRPMETAIPGLHLTETKKKIPKCQLWVNQGFWGFNVNYLAVASQ